MRQRAVIFPWFACLSSLLQSGCPQPNLAYCDEQIACQPGQSCQLPAHVCAATAPGDGGAQPLDGGLSSSDLRAAGDLAEARLELLGYGLLVTNSACPAGSTSLGPPALYDAVSGPGSCSGCRCNPSTPCTWEAVAYRDSTCGMLLQSAVVSGPINCVFLPKAAAYSVTAMSATCDWPSGSPQLDRGFHKQALLCLVNNAKRNCETANCVAAQISGSAACMALPEGSRCPDAFPRDSTWYQRYTELRSPCQCRCAASACTNPRTLRADTSCGGTGYSLDNGACKANVATFGSEAPRSVQWLSQSATCITQYDPVLAADPSQLAEPVQLCCQR